MAARRGGETMSDFFHMKERRAQQWVEMLSDAPTDYHPDFIDRLQNEPLREHLRNLYMELRREQDTGGGVTRLRDLMLRRVVWLARIASKLEDEIERAEIEDLAALKDHGQKRKLERLNTLYLRVTKTMLEISYHITPPKKRRKTSAGRLGLGKVVIPTDG